MKRLIAFAIAVVMLAAVNITIAREETVGERFRKVMAEIETQCKKDKLGPYLDPADPQYHEKKRQTDCDILTLKPVDPLATPEGRFAYSLKLPPPNDKPKNVYKPGMTGEQYFEALCKAEAGEWVFRRVEGVEGIFQARPFENENHVLGHLFAYESIGGEGLANRENPQDALVQPPVGGYNYLEVPIRDSVSGDGQPKYLHHYRDPGIKPNKPFYYTRKGSYRNFETRYIVATKAIDVPTSKYAYTQRGIVRANALENGIKGAELLIFNRSSGEVLAFRRYFMRFHFDPKYSDRRQLFSKACGPNTSGFRFVQQVLGPINNKKSDSDGG